MAIVAQPTLGLDCERPRNRSSGTAEGLQKAHRTKDCRQHSGNASCPPSVKGPLLRCRGLARGEPQPKQWLMTMAGRSPSRPSTSPSWFYLDSVGQEYGPVPGWTMHEWLTLGRFPVGRDLRVRLLEWERHLPLHKLYPNLVGAFMLPPAWPEVYSGGVLKDADTESELISRIRASAAGRRHGLEDHSPHEAAPLPGSGSCGVADLGAEAVPMGMAHPCEESSSRERLPEPSQTKPEEILARLMSDGSLLPTPQSKMQVDDSSADRDLDGMFSEDFYSHPCGNGLAPVGVLAGTA